MQYELEFSGRGDKIVLSKRGLDDPHVMFHIFAEDDGYWHYKLSASSFWLRDLITQLQRAEQAIRALPYISPSPDGFGYIFVEGRGEYIPNIENGHNV